MKLQRMVMTVVGGLAIILATGLPANAKNQHRLRLFNEATMGATNLAPGEYLIKWETHSPEATITFLMNKKIVGELKGKIVEHQTKFARDVVEDGPGPNGSRVLLGVSLGGTNKSIVFTP